MTINEYYELGNKAYEEERYEDALKYYTAAAPENEDAAATIPLCYMHLAFQLSENASNHTNNTELLVRGQQSAVKVLDTAIRSALSLYRDYPGNPSVCNIAPMVICISLDAQYSLVSTGLTTAYNITETKTTIHKTVLQTKVGENVVKEEILWEDIIGQETNSFVSLTSYDFSDYHIIGPDEKTKRINASLKTILNNSIQIAEIMECVGHGYDANIVRATIACSMASADGGDRSMLLAAEWFIARAKEQAKETMTEEVYQNWLVFIDSTLENYLNLSIKYAPLLRSYRKNGQKPNLAKFYTPYAKVPAIESCAEYILEQEINKNADEHMSRKSDFFQVFLTVFSQISFKKIFPTILFSSVITLFCGGFIRVFSSEADKSVLWFGLIWFIITFLLTLFRTFANADEFRTNNTFKIYMATMLGTAVLFSFHFLVGLPIYIILYFLSAKYK